MIHGNPYPGTAFSEAGFCRPLSPSRWSRPPPLRRSHKTALPVTRVRRGPACNPAPVGTRILVGPVCIAGKAVEADLDSSFLVRRGASYHTGRHRAAGAAGRGALSGYVTLFAAEGT